MAFWAGIISFFSPCVLPLIPLYLSFISGISIEELKTADGSNPKINWKVGINALFYVLGFAFVFTLMGATASLVGQLLILYKDVVEKLAAIIIIVFGLHLSGILPIKYFYGEKRIHPRQKKWGVLGSFLIGAAFAFGWTPCIGPILGSILAYAAATQSLSQGAALLFAYALGIGIPFLLAGIFVDFFINKLSRFNKFLNTAIIIVGLFLMGIGFWIFIFGFKTLPLLHLGLG
jgi:cytochrome c-type biogenesis protein